MSQSTPRFEDSALSDSQSESSTLAWLYTWVRESIEATAFWTAVTLPVFYLPLILTGLDGQTLLAFVGLLALNALALVFGHSHNRERGTESHHSNN